MAVKKMKQEMIPTNEQKNPLAILEQAVRSGANVEVMERLMGLAERYQANQARQAYDKAMAELRPNLPRIVKENVVDFGVNKAKYKYEDLATMTEQLSPVMHKHGLSFRWRTQSLDNGWQKVVCIIAHEDGHSEETSLTCRPDTSGNKNEIQAIGSAVTYLQRYTLKAALGIAAAEDDDAQAVTPPRSAEPPDIISGEQVRRLWSIARAKGMSDEAIQDLILKRGYSSSKSIKRSDYDAIIAVIEGGQE